MGTNYIGLSSMGRTSTKLGYGGRSGFLHLGLNKERIETEVVLVAFSFLFDAPETQCDHA